MIYENDLDIQNKMLGMEYGDTPRELTEDEKDIVTAIVVSHNDEKWTGQVIDQDAAADTEIAVFAGDFSYYIVTDSDGVVVMIDWQDMFRRHQGQPNAEEVYNLFLHHINEFAHKNNISTFDRVAIQFDNLNDANEAVNTIMNISPFLALWEKRIARAVEDPNYNPARLDEVKYLEGFNTVHPVIQDLIEDIEESWGSVTASPGSRFMPDLKIHVEIDKVPLTLTLTGNIRTKFLDPDDKLTISLYPKIHGTYGHLNRTEYNKIYDAIERLLLQWTKEHGSNFLYPSREFKNSAQAAIAWTEDMLNDVIPQIKEIEKKFLSVSETSAGLPSDFFSGQPEGYNVGETYKLKATSDTVKIIDVSRDKSGEAIITVRWDNPGATQREAKLTTNEFDIYFEPLEMKEDIDTGKTQTLPDEIMDVAEMMDELLPNDIEVRHEPHNYANSFYLFSDKKDPEAELDIQVVIDQSTRDVLPIGYENRNPGFSPDHKVKITIAAQMHNVEFAIRWKTEKFDRFDQNAFSFIENNMMELSDPIFIANAKQKFKDANDRWEAENLDEVDYSYRRIQSLHPWLQELAENLEERYAPVYVTKFSWPDHYGLKVGEDVLVEIRHWRDGTSISHSPDGIEIKQFDPEQTKFIIDVRRGRGRPPPSAGGGKYDWEVFNRGAQKKAEIWLEHVLDLLFFPKDNQKNIQEYEVDDSVETVSPFIVDVVEEIEQVHGPTTRIDQNSERGIPRYDIYAGLITYSILMRTEAYPNTTIRIDMSDLFNAEDEIEIRGDKNKEKRQREQIREVLQEFVNYVTENYDSSPKSVGNWFYTGADWGNVTLANLVPDEERVAETLSDLLMVIGPVHEKIDEILGITGQDMNERSYRSGPIGPYVDPENGDEGQVDDLVPMIIDLGSSRRGDLDESWLAMFGGAIEMIMNRMFGGPKVPVTVRGTRSEIKSFTKTLGSEKRYMDAYTKYGLDDPRTYKSKFRLDNAVRNFERKTGITWPFK